MNKWISVEERLPENKDKYLVRAIGEKKAFCAYFYLYHAEPCWQADSDMHFDYGSSSFKVTHWMPIPELEAAEAEVEDLKRKIKDAMVEARKERV